jgi:hypothetical protein
MVSRPAGRDACPRPPNERPHMLRKLALGLLVITTLAAAAPPMASAGIIMRDGGICDPIRHMGC